MSGQVARFRLRKRTLGATTGDAVPADPVRTGQIEMVRSPSTIFANASRSRPTRDAGGRFVVGFAAVCEGSTRAALHRAQCVSFATSDCVGTI